MRRMINRAKMKETHIQDVVHVDWQQLQKAWSSACLDGVSGMIGVCPRIGALGEAAIGKRIKQTLVRI